MDAVLGRNATFGLQLDPETKTRSQSTGALVVGELDTTSEPQLITISVQNMASRSNESAVLAGTLGAFVQRLIVSGATHTFYEPWPLVAVAFPAPDVEQTPRPEIMNASQVVASILALTGLSKAELADELLGVSRTAIHNWERGHVLSTSNEAKIRGMLDVLQRASRRHHTPSQMRAWLLTPVGVDSVRPIDLLKEGSFDRARMLAITTPSPQLAKVPKWVREPAAWAEGGEVGQEAYPEGDELLIQLPTPSGR